MIHSKIEGSGKPLLIIHGFLGMLDNWKTLATQYAEQGFEVHSLDMRNHGKSFHTDDFSYPIMVQDVMEYCMFHNLTRINLIGHSMGGKVAMLLAVSHPTIVEKVIVADISPKYYAPHHQTILSALQAVDFTKKPTRTEIEQILSKYIPEVGVRQFLLKNVYWKTPEQLAFRFNLPVFIKNIDEIGKSLPENTIFDQSILFLKGEFSDYITPADEPLIFKHFPAAKIKIINKAGHWLHAENPTDFFEQTLEFLKN